jgi:hypothetical protein
MDESGLTPLVKVSRTDLALEGPLGDVRRRQVVTADDQGVGTIVDLIVDRRTKRIRFLEFQADELDGIGQHLGLIPVQAVERVDEYHVYVGCTRGVIASAPTYNPHIALVDLYVHEVYEHFGCPLPDGPGTETPSRTSGGSDGGIGSGQGIG